MSRTSMERRYNIVEIDDIQSARETMRKRQKGRSLKFPAPGTVRIEVSFSDSLKPFSKIGFRAHLSRLPCPNASGFA